MARPALDAFVDALRRYRLLEPLQLEEVAASIGARLPDAKALAGELIRLGWLTPYQANQLLQGKGGELLLGSYLLLEKLGEGGMGSVFKARNWKLGRVVAVKLIRQERLANPDAVRRFQREVRAAALDHPNVVRALDPDQVGGTHLLVMEYVEGAADLSRLVKASGPLPVAQACEYVRQAALGLQHAHERGLVHCVVKPANLLLSVGAAVKVLDMGLARRDQPPSDDDTSSTVTQEGAVMGTPDYIAPEQALESHSVDTRADQYSLGCALYFLLTARVPFPGGTFIQKVNRHQFEEPVPVERLRPQVPPGVAGVVRRLIAKRPQDRYQTPAQAAAALASALVPAGAPGGFGERTVAEGLQPAAGDSDSGDTASSPFAHLDAGEQAAVKPRQGLHGEGSRLLAGVLAGCAAFWGMPLRELTCPFNPYRDAEVLRLIKTLASINHRPAGEFWKEVDEKQAAFGGWCKQVAALPAQKQVEAVAARLRELNRGFDPKAAALANVAEGGVVTELRLLADDVTDVSPVRALPGLKSLTCKGGAFGRGKLSDLWPLAGMRLTSLCCDHTQVADLSPLAGMRLTSLACYDSKVSSLSPVTGMGLTSLNCSGTNVSDLSPLQGMQLTTLDCSGTPVSDLSPLKGMPLKELRCDFKPGRDAGVLRAIKTLESINRKPAKQFWEEAVAGK